MKAFTIIFAIIMVSNVDVNADSDYNRLAANIQTNITTLLTDLSKVDDKVQMIHGHLPSLANTINFKLSEDKQIIELQTSLKAHQFRKNILDCVRLYDNKTQTLIAELKVKFIDLVDEHLNVMKISLFETRQELVNISLSLSGTKLVDEINVCENTPQNCKITIDYPNTITKDRQYVFSVQNVADTIVDNVLATAIMPTISDQINTEVYQPVNACIVKLN